jgi:LPS sulfotransferase NodH
MIRFILLSTYRSGTVLLRTMLNAHPRVSCYSEVFRQGYEFEDLAERYNDEALAEGIALHSREPVTFLEKYCFSSSGDAQDASGFTLMYDQPVSTERDLVWTWLAGDLQIRVIHLRRYNELLRYASLCRAAKTGKWVSLRLPQLPPPPVHVDPYAFLANVAATRQQRDQALRRLIDHPTLTLTYEDLIADTERQLSLVFDFMGVEPMAVQPTTFKQGSASARASISNYDELRKRLAGTTVARWLGAEPNLDPRLQTGREKHGT